MPRLIFLSSKRAKKLDLIEPGRTGWRQMHVPARPSCQPVADQRRFVHGVIIHHEMDDEIARDSGDLVEELAELRGAMASIAFADDPARRDIERGKQRCCAVAGEVVAVRCRLAGPHRQHGLASVERLYLGLLIYPQDNGVRCGGET